MGNSPATDADDTVGHAGNRGVMGDHGGDRAQFAVYPLQHFEHQLAGGIVERLGGVKRMLGDLGHQRDVLKLGEAGDQVVELEHEAHVLAAEARQAVVVGGAP